MYMYVCIYIYIYIYIHINHTRKLHRTRGHTTDTYPVSIMHRFDIPEEDGKAQDPK